MAFRDETEALRARIGMLERELETLRDAATERDRLQAQVAELEERLGVAREKREREAERARARRAERWRQGSGARAKVLRGLALVLGIGAALFGVSRIIGGGCAPSRDAAPSLGLVDLDATLEPAFPPLTTRGTVSTPGDCRGFVPDAPQLVLRSTGPVSIRIAPQAVSGDLVLLVIDAEGRVLCDDDSGGSRNPLVTAVLPPGDARVWIGTYSVGESIDFSLSMSALPAPASPDGRVRPSLGVFDGPTEGELVLPGSVQPIAPASSVDASCRGYLPVEPQLTVRLARRAAVRLRASGSADLVMLVRGPDGSVLCDDDSGHGNEPQIATALEAGEHHVWVGTFSERAEPASFMLSALARDLDRTAPAELGERELREGAEIVVEDTSRDEIAPHAIGAACGGGLVGAQPHVVLRTVSASDVLLALASESAPFAVIEHPDRTFECVVSGRARHHWAAGAHRIYVGTQQESTPGPFTLTARAEPSSVRPWTP